MNYDKLSRALRYKKCISVDVKKKKSIISILFENGQQIQLRISSDDVMMFVLLCEGEKYIFLGIETSAPAWFCEILLLYSN